MTMKYKFPKLFNPTSSNGKALLSKWSLDDEVFVTEKLDGANFSVWNRGDKILFRKRNFVIQSESKNDAPYYVRIVDFGLDRFENVPKDFIYFGEIDIPHTIKYNKPFGIKFYAVFNTKTERFVSVRTAKLMIENTGFEFVPIIDITTFKDILRIVEVSGWEGLVPKNSAFDGMCEGVVLWNTDTNEKLAIKVKSPEFMDIFKNVSYRFYKKKPRRKNVNAVTFFGLERITNVYHSLKDTGIDGLEKEHLGEFISAIISDYIVEELGIKPEDENFKETFKIFKKKYSSSIYNFVSKDFADIIKELTGV